jgi:6-phosphogluconolactonase
LRSARVLVSESEETFAAEGARQIVEGIARSLARGGRSAVVLAGGSTPIPVYRLLAASYVDALEWERVSFFIGDERAVAADDERSNGRAIGEALAPLLMWARLHRIAGELGAAEAAADYARRIKRLFGEEVPRFDLSILGVGEDGHTASLFPDCAESDRSRNALVVSTTSPVPPRDRISLGYQTLERASRTLFLVRGRVKAAVVAAASSGRSDVPAARISGRAPDVLWLLDPPAASLLTCEPAEWSEATGDSSRR